MDANILDVIANKALFADAVVSAFINNEQDVSFGMLSLCINECMPLFEEYKEEVSYYNDVLACHSIVEVVGVLDAFADYSLTRLSNEFGYTFL